MVWAVAVGPEHGIGHAEHGRDNEGADVFPDYLISGGYLEKTAGEAFGYEGVTVGEALGPAGEVGEEGYQRQAAVLPHDFAGGWVNLDDP